MEENFCGHRLSLGLAGVFFTKKNPIDRTAAEIQARHEIFLGDVKKSDKTT